MIFCLTIRLQALDLYLTIRLRALALYLTIRLRARDSYEVIIDEGKARINYYLIKIECE